MNGQRLVYMDIAKGICMLLVVMVHTGISEPLPHLYALKVVLFFVLSGYFFYDDMTFLSFIRKKAYTLLLPFAVFWLLSYMLFYVLLWKMPGFASFTEAKGILDCFTQKSYFNGPLWFLLSLFEVQILEYIIRAMVRLKWFRWVLLLAISYCGFWLGNANIDLPLNLDSAMTMTVFFALGHVLKDVRFWDRLSGMVCMAIAIGGYALISFFPVDCYASVNRYVCISFMELLFVLSILCIGCVCVCKALSIAPPQDLVDSSC